MSQRSCQFCGCRLARDNGGARACGPCQSTTREAMVLDEGYERALRVVSVYCDGRRKDPKSYLQDLTRVLDDLAIALGFTPPDLERMVSGRAPGGGEVAGGRPELLQEVV